MAKLGSFLVTLGSGIVGAVALTTLHQSLRRREPTLAPRLDIFGKRILKKGLLAAGYRPPRGEKLERLALAGDLFVNSLFYAMVGRSRPLRRGLLLGSAAGAGAVILPPLLGLGRLPRGMRKETKLLTAGLYLAGGLAAGLSSYLLRRKEHARDVIEESFVRDVRYETLD